MNLLDLILLIVCNMVVGCIAGWITIYAGGTQAFILALVYIITVIVLIIRNR